MCHAPTNQTFQGGYKCTCKAAIRLTRNCAIDRAAEREDKDAAMATDEDTVDITFKTIRVPGARGGAYGLSFRGSCPVMLVGVDPGSPADKAGLMKGDFLVQLNGNDIQRSSEEAVRTIIKYSQGSKLTVRVGRPHPFPSTDYLRRRAIIILQTKLAAGVADTNDDAASYKKTVESAFLEVQDILGSLGLGDDDGIHGNNQSVQEVKVSYQGDGDSLESPPDSEKDPFEVLDPLLDFGLDDDLTISKGSGGGANTGADLVRSTIEVQRALKGIKQLTDGINAAKEQKRLENERGKITTEATFTANFQSSSTTNRTQQPSASHPVPPTYYSSLSPQNDAPAWNVAPTSAGVNGVRERAVQEQGSALHSERKSAPSSNGYKQERNSGRGVVAPPTFREQQREDEEEDFSYYSRKKQSRSPPPLDQQPAKVERRKKKKAVKQTFSAPPPPITAYQPKEESSPPLGLVQSSSSYSRRNEDEAPPPAIPPYNPAGPEEFLLSNKPEYKKEWKKMTNTYESVSERETVSPPPPEAATYETVRERGSAPLPTSAAYRTSKERGVVPQIRYTNETSRERSASPPPPVPVRQHHSLAKTFSEPPSSQKSPASSSRDKYKDISLADVPLRSKKRGANQIAAAQEPAPVGHVEQHNSGRKIKYNVSSGPTSLPVAVKDVSDVLTSCAGLPSNVHQWKKDDVGVWLKQMSPTLHAHYSALFAKHDVTGRTLLRLNATKLQLLGVTTPGHCRILATEIMRVRIHQEANELRAFRR